MAYPGKNMHIYSKILLRRQSKIIIEPGYDRQPHSVIMHMQAELEKLGFTMGADLITIISTFPSKGLSQFYNELMNELQLESDNPYGYTPLFINFPKNNINGELYLKTREEATEAPWFLDSHDKIREYRVLSCGHSIYTGPEAVFDLSEFGACPLCQMSVPELAEQERGARSPLCITDITPLKVIGVTDRYEPLFLAKELMSSPATLNPQDREDLLSIINEAREEILWYLPTAFQQKETMVLVTEALMCVMPSITNIMKDYYKTATDVLRLATAFSGGDISLYKNTKFKLSNQQRRLIMALLDEISEPKEDLKRHCEKWKKLAHCLHINSYAKKYPNAKAAITALRNSAKYIVTFDGNAELLLFKLRKKEVNSLEALLKLLEQRPGDFAKRLDSVLSISEDKGRVVQSFAKVISKVPSKTLLTMNKHFQCRNKPYNFRHYLINSPRAAFKYAEGDERVAFSGSLIDELTGLFEAELKSRFRKKGKIGPVHVSPELKRILVPFSQRGTSPGTRALQRGSRIKLDENKQFVRAYVHWKENNLSGRVDVDLSSGLYDSDFNQVGSVFYRNYDEADAVFYSGDVQSAPNGASEYIDIDIKALISKGVRYINFMVSSYTEQPFSSFTCHTGVIGISNRTEGEIFEPSLVMNQFDIESESVSVATMILDLDEMEMIWLDTDMPNSDGFNNFDTNSKKLMEASKIAVSLVDTKPNIYDLIKLNVEARGGTIDELMGPNSVYEESFCTLFANNKEHVLSILL